MASQQDLDASLTALTDDIATLVTAVTTNSSAIEALLAKIASGTTPVDLSAEVAQVASADKALKDAIAAIASEDTKASV